jgi:hypothetical protein
VDQDAPPPIAEDLILAVTTGLLRKGLLDEADIEAMCAGLNDETAHQLRCCVLEAAAPSQSEWRAEMARRRFVVVKNEGEGDR